MKDFIATIRSLGIEIAGTRKEQGYIPVPGTPVEMPYTLISGTNTGKAILITGGVHGGEYPCIETAIQLSKRLQPDQVNGAILIIHPVNVPAFLAKMQYYGPYDGKNLNRVFPGKATGTVSERIAYTINQLQKSADFYMDLHGGDIHESLVPFVIYSNVGGKELAEESKRASEMVGFPYVVGSMSEGGSIGGAALSGTPGFLAELGQCGRWSQEEVADYISGIENVLKSMDVIPGEAEKKPVQSLAKMAVTTSLNEGCWYAHKSLDQVVEKGEKVGEVKDFFGHTLSEYVAEESGTILYLVTSLAITEGDPLFAIGVE